MLQTCSSECSMVSNRPDRHSVRFYFLVAGVRFHDNIVSQMETCVPCHSRPHAVLA